ncbi:hypothetical protein NOX35_28605 (plasmid) [Comamonas sp. C11]|nr:hypothetical protein [Comamonas sp. C11]UUC96757.1 hypothetical protein NOX35_28605 [Comamonas sp. C11]
MMNRTVTPKRSLMKAGSVTLSICVVDGIDPISGMESFTKFATEADSGGIFVDMNIHDVDLIRWFTGQEPVQAYGLTSNLAAPELGENW